MKKVLSVVLAALLAASSALLLVSCGKEAEEIEAETETEVVETTETEDTAAESEATEEDNKFVIGITYFAPMNYFDENGELTGFETEFAKAVCAKLGYEPEFVEIDWDTKEIELNAGSIDCIWNGLTVTEERANNMALTDPYMANKQVLVVKAENLSEYSEASGLAGMNVCAEEGSAGEEVITGDDIFASSNYTGVATQAMALMEVEAGTSDGCVIDYVTSIGMIGDGTDYSDLVVVDAYEFSVEYYAIAFANDNAATRDAFNEAIDELKADGTVDAIAAAYKLEDRIVK